MPCALDLVGSVLAEGLELLGGHFDGEGLGWACARGLVEQATPLLAQLLLTLQARGGGEDLGDGREGKGAIGRGGGGG